MDLCRVCLVPEPNKDILSESLKARSDNKSFAEIFMFCFDIQVNNPLFDYYTPVLVSIISK